MKQSFPGGFLLEQRINLPGGIDMTQQATIFDPEARAASRTLRHLPGGSFTPRKTIGIHLHLLPAATPMRIIGAGFNLRISKLSHWAQLSGFHPASTTAATPTEGTPPWNA